jgi:NAD(P)H-dependent FMN reductase
MNNKKPTIYLILGSTRKGRMSEKFGTPLKRLADKREDITTEIIDLRDYHLPFLNDEIPPSDRKVITDPVVQRWSDKIQEADGFIIITPEYNFGYPGVLKNALDVLYKEWNEKPVAFIGYSAGQTGATSSISHLRHVARGLKMKAVPAQISIPNELKALDSHGHFVDKNIEHYFNTVVDQIINALAKN